MIRRILEFECGDKKTKMMKANRRLITHTFGCTHPSQFTDQLWSSALMVLAVVVHIYIAILGQHLLLLTFSVAFPFNLPPNIVVENNMRTLMISIQPSSDSISQYCLHDLIRWWLVQLIILLQLSITLDKGLFVGFICKSLEEACQKTLYLNKCSCQVQSIVVLVSLTGDDGEQEST